MFVEKHFSLRLFLNCSFFSSDYSLNVLTKFVLIKKKRVYNEVPRYRKKCSLLLGVRYSGNLVITNYLANSKNIRYSGVTKLDQAEQWDIHLAKESTDLRVNSYI